MDIERQLDIVEDWLGRDMTTEEEAVARQMLVVKGSQFGGSNSPGYVALYLDMHRKAGTKAA